MEVGQRLFRARKQLNMSRAELGKKVNLHESTIKRYEDGQIKALDIEKMKEFSKALDIDPAYLMGWDKRHPNQQIQDGSKSLLFFYNKLNNVGKKEALKRIEELTLVSKYSYSTIDNDIDDDYNNIITIAAHNDYVMEENEIDYIKEDIEDMKNW